MHGSHVQWSATLGILDIWIGTSLGEQLHTESTMVREGSVMERGLSLVIESIDGDPILEENVHYYILAVIASHMERCTATGVDSIRLAGRGGEGRKKIHVL